MFQKSFANSKPLWAILIVALLLATLSGTALIVTQSRASEIMSLTELKTNFAGTVGCSVFQLADGSYVLNTVNKSSTFIVKLDSSFNPLWTKTIKIGQENTVLQRFLPTSDGGFALGGVINNNYVLVKTDSQGNIQWIHTFNSGAPINYLRAIIQTGDGGFAIAGFGEPVEEGLGWIWFAKTDSSGGTEWNKTFAGPVSDCPSAIIQTSDGGFVMSDVSYSFVPDQGFFRLIKMDMNGNVLWNTTYGGQTNYLKPECNLAIATKDGGYMLAGYLWDTSAWVVKTDGIGDMQWNQTYGAEGSSITGILENQNRYLLLSITNKRDAGLRLINEVGKELWNTTFPGVSLPIGFEANFHSIIQARNGDYILTGSKNESVWLAKLNLQDEMSPMVQVLPFAATMVSVVVVVATLSILIQRKVNSNNRRLS